jgi:hypothetical protein
MLDGLLLASSRDSFASQSRSFQNVISAGIPNYLADKVVETGGFLLLFLRKSHLRTRRCSKDKRRIKSLT